MNLKLDKKTQKKFNKGFKKASKDSEMLEMAEEGMDDYFEQIKKLECESLE